MSVLPPVAVYGADHVDEHHHRAARALVRDLVGAIDDTAPIPFRSQNGGDYDRHLVLLPDRAAGATGVGVHTRMPGTG